ncbi:GNAT family N-acetyltransferase [Arenibacterium sp. LLYu02]|uniref:GNAT family N-acetyltransferase n=1 Tax=Arenibacterium sp. LLYu02 TaxID=3404132 RepID=UPI003B20F337
MILTQPKAAERRAPLFLRSQSIGLSLRPICAEDMAFLCALYRSTREAELDRVPWSEAQKQSFIEMQFQAQHSHYQTHYPDALWLVIESRGIGAIGRLYLERWEQEHRIIDIALIPSVRGHGLGRALLEDLMDEAAAAKKAITIHVEKENPAMRLYQRLGFRRIEDKGVYDLLSWQA